MQMRAMIFLSCGMTLVGAAGWAAEPVTPIGTLLVSPSAVHRKVFKLEGIAKKRRGVFWNGTEHQAASQWR